MNNLPIYIIIILLVLVFFLIVKYSVQYKVLQATITAYHEKNALVRALLQNNAFAETCWKTLLDVLDEVADVGIAEVALSGVVKRCNKRFEELCGYSSEELSALSLHDITHPDYLGEDLRLANSLLNREIDNYTLKKIYIKEGLLYPCTLFVTLKRSNFGEPEFFFSIMRENSFSQGENGVSG